MTDHSPLSDEALLSGYLDGELTQAERQRVALLLERDAAARQLYRELQEMRQIARTTRFVTPDDRQWSELPHSAGSRFSRLMGWGLLLPWLVLVVGFALWQLAASPAGMVEKLLAFGGLSGFGLLFLSVFLDRVRLARTDRYRRVEK